MLQEVIKSVHHKLYVLAKVRPCINARTALTIYKCKILPFIDYGDILYNEIDQTLTKKLQTLQNCCLRIAFRLSRRTNVDNYHVRNNLLHTENRRILHLLTYMYNIVGTSDLVDSRQLPTRQFDGPVFRTIHPRTTWFKKTFLYQGITRWNNLPADLRNIRDSDSFKRRVKKVLLCEESIMYP